MQIIQLSKCTDVTYLLHIKKEGIKIGTPKYIINFDFFNNDSEELWYFYGLLASDGYINDNVIELCLNNKDEKIWLCNVTHEVCGEHPAELFITHIFPLQKG